MPYRGLISQTAFMRENAVALALWPERGKSTFAGSRWNSSRRSHIGSHCHDDARRCRRAVGAERDTLGKVSILRRQHFVSQGLRLIATIQACRPCWVKSMPARRTFA